MELNDLGYRSKIFVFIIGSRGHVHRRFVSGLKNIGFSLTESEYLAKYLSISVIIGSYKIWKFKCKFNLGIGFNKSFIIAFTFKS